MNPGEIWRAAKNAATPEMMGRIARTLRVHAPDLAQFEYILAPFAPYNDGDAWWLAAITTPCPVNVPECLAWQPIDDVILIDGANGAMRTIDAEPSILIEPETPSDGAVKFYTNGIVFARDWAAERARWIDGIARGLVPGLRAEPSGQPGIALCGNLGDVVDFASLRASERVLVDDPRAMRDLTKALLRSARLPTVDIMPPRLRVAA